MTNFKKTKMIEKMEEIKEKALNFIEKEHTRWQQNDPEGLAEKLLQANDLLEGVDYIISEVEFLDDDAQIEFVEKGKFEKLKSLSNTIRRLDLKKSRSVLDKLYPNLERMEVIIEHPSYKMGMLSIYESNPVYVIYVVRI